MRIPVSSHCLLIALAIAALVTSVLHIDRLQRRIDALRSENENLISENAKLKTNFQKRESDLIYTQQIMSALAAAQTAPFGGLPKENK
jgi:hypothetical protein